MSELDFAKQEFERHLGDAASCTSVAMQYTPGHTGSVQKFSFGVHTGDRSTTIEATQLDNEAQSAVLARAAMQAAHWAASVRPT